MTAEQEARKNSIGQIKNEVLTASQVVEELSGLLARGTVYKLLRTGELPAKRIGRKFFVPRARLEQWLLDTGH
ncbi:MAG: helix-turn-helix domain-containing protein [Bryobacteraceae bacterium]